MNLIAFLGVLAIVYGVAVILMALKKPIRIWNMRKIQGFIRVLGHRGTDIFFYIWGIAFAGLGFWLLSK